MRGRTSTVRALALLSASAAAIHQLRYAIGYGDAAPHALAEHPHAYMAAALPAVMALAIVSLSLLLMRLARGGRGATGTRAPLWLVWLGCSLALAAIFGVQETLEGAGAFAGGGWIGLALAVPAGLLVALALRGSAAAELTVPGVALRFVMRVAIARVTSAIAVVARMCERPLGARAPPLPSVV